MAKTTEEAEAQVFRRLMEVCEDLGDNGTQNEEMERGAAALLARLSFEKTPSSMVVTSFSGVGEQDTEHKVFTGLHTPTP